MADGLRQVAALPDPVGEVVDGWVRPNGLRIRRVRVPLGVVGIIYENRPNVTSDAAGLCLKTRQRRASCGARRGASRSNQAIAARPAGGRGQGGPARRRGHPGRGHQPGGARSSSCACAGSSTA